MLQKFSAYKHYWNIKDSITQNPEAFQLESMELKIVPLKAAVFEQRAFHEHLVKGINLQGNSA